MTFSQAEWNRSQLRQQSEDKKFAKKMAALAKKTARGGAKVTGRTGRKFPSGRATRGQGSWIKKGLSQALSYQQHHGSLAAIAYSRNQEGAVQLDSNLLETDPDRQVEELRLEARRHPQTREDLVFLHLSISLNPRLKDLSHEEFLKIAHDHLRRTGFEGCSFIVVLHPRNAAHGQHIHVIVSRSKNGKLVSLSNSFWRFREALRDVEAQNGLKAVMVPVDTPLAPTTSAATAERRAVRHKTQPNVWISPELILEQAGISRSWNEFVERCAAKNICVELATRVTDNVVTGVLYKSSTSETWLSGSTLSRRCTYSKIKSEIDANGVTHAENERQVLLMKLQRDALSKTNNRMQKRTSDRPRGG